MEKRIRLKFKLPLVLNDDNRLVFKDLELALSQAQKRANQQGKAFSVYCIKDGCPYIITSNKVQMDRFKRPGALLVTIAPNAFPVMELDVKSYDNPFTIRKETVKV